MGKDHKSFDEQVDLLKARNMKIDDEEQAKMFLSMVSYYRFASYRFPFLNNSSTSKQEYHPNTTFYQPMDLYTFDVRYKSKLMELLGFIEIAFKTQVIYNFSKQDSLFYLNETNYKPIGYPDKNGINKDRVEEHIERLKKQVKNINNVHINFYKENHDKNNSCKKSYLECKTCYPEAWVGLEALDFGSVINIYEKLSPKFSQEKQAVREYFQIGSKSFLSILSEIKRLRNIVAHHDKIIDRYKFKKSKSLKELQNIYNMRIENNQASTFLPYFLVVKHLMETLLQGAKKDNSYSQHMLSSYQEFLDISKKCKKYLSLDHLKDNFFEFE